MPQEKYRFRFYAIGSTSQNKVSLDIGSIRRTIVDQIHDYDVYIKVHNFDTVGAHTGVLMLTSNMTQSPSSLAMGQTYTIIDILNRNGAIYKTDDKILVQIPSNMIVDFVVLKEDMTAPTFNNNQFYLNVEFIFKKK